MKLGIVTCKVSIIINGEVCFKEGEMYPISITKTKIKAKNELGLEHVIADSNRPYTELVLQDGFFKNHFDLIK